MACPNSTEKIYQNYKRKLEEAPVFKYLKPMLISLDCWYQPFCHDHWHRIFKTTIDRADASAR
jgi:hypothetical protein